MSRRPRTPISTHRRGRAVLAAATGFACAAVLAIAPASAAVDDKPGSRPGALPVLKGSVGPGFVISINDDSVPAGRYRLVINDMGTIHNFHIFGTGVDKATGIPATGKFKFRIRLRPGTYEIQCDAHSLQMKTTLTVT